MTIVEKLGRERFKQINNWMYRNARPLDIARWRYLFLDGNRDDVAAALVAYQNEDGGFGNALEADFWNPNSSPYATATAIGLLRETGIDDKDHDIIKGILRYLSDSPEYAVGHWPAVISSNNDYPHAPWWTYSADTRGDWGYTPTAKLVGFILSHSEKETAIYKRAEQIAKDAVKQYLYGKTADGRAYRDVNNEGEVDCFHYLVECIEDAESADSFDVYELKEALRVQAGKFIERDASKWTQYCCKPSTFITSPSSMFYEGNEDIVNAELEFILTQRNAEGVWNITWSWGAYEKEFAVSEVWWKANIVIWNIRFLKAFGRL